MFSKATLIEPGVKYFLDETLKKHNQNRVYNYNMIINISLLLCFILLIIGLLIYKYKTRRSPEEKKKMNYLKENYILNRIRSLNSDQKRETEKMITNLPKFESDFVKLHENFYNI
tara:strand:+ start:4524 stop:4868 length:345 start_codon:yes stop_codon:yes gene_type:complete